MTRLDELLRAAGDMTRLRLLNLLWRGSVCVCDLQRVLGLTQPTVSRHLAVLRNARLVLDVRRRNRVLYSVIAPDTPQQEAFFEFLEKCSANDETMQNDLRILASVLQQGECVTAEVPNAMEKIAS